MSIVAKTADPDALLTSLKNSIKKGTIRSWSVDKDGDFCHDADQICGKCFLEPKTIAGALSFTVKWYKGVQPDPEFAAELHAHAVRMLMIHGGSAVGLILIAK